jgi:hypothetical protein
MAYLYAALTLHAAGKEINEKNLRKVLEAVGVQVDEATVKALMTLVTALKATPQIVPTEVPAAPSTPPLIPPETTTYQSVAPVETTPTPMPPPITLSETEPIHAEALYLYCLAEGAEEVNFGKIGIEGNEVYIIPYDDISAVVHKCPPKPYQSEDREVVKSWVMAHQRVVDAAWEKFGNVLPSGFDTIIKGDETLSAEENLKKWLREDHENLKAKLEKVRGKAEVGVQIFWDPKVIAESLMETSEEIRKLNEEMRGKPPGMAYFYKQKMEQALKKEMDEKADNYFKNFYGRVKKYADDIHVEKTMKIDKDKQMLMNLSVLVHRDKIKLLGEELAEIKEIGGIDVRFTGPWPPYSFVAPG